MQMTLPKLIAGSYGTANESAGMPSLSGPGNLLATMHLGNPNYQIWDIAWIPPNLRGQVPTAQVQCFWVDGKAVTIKGKDIIKRDGAEEYKLAELPNPPTDGLKNGHWRFCPSSDCLLFDGQTVWLEWRSQNVDPNLPGQWRLIAMEVGPHEWRARYYANLQDFTNEPNVYRARIAHEIYSNQRSGEVHIIHPRSGPGFDRDDYVKTWWTARLAKKGDRLESKIPTDCWSRSEVLTMDEETLIEKEPNLGINHPCWIGTKMGYTAWVGGEGAIVFRGWGNREPIRFGRNRIANHLHFDPNTGEVICSVDIRNQDGTAWDQECVELYDKDNQLIYSWDNYHVKDGRFEALAQPWVMYGNYAFTVPDGNTTDFVIYRPQEQTPDPELAERVAKLEEDVMALQDLTLQHDRRFTLISAAASYGEE